MDSVALLFPLGSVDWVLISLVTSLLVTGAVWTGFRTRFPDATSAAGLVGVFLLFGQTLDGVTTIIGIDVLGFTEEVPLSQAVLTLAGQLPISSVIGVGRALFLLKLGLVAGMLITFYPGDNGDTFTDVAVVAAGLAGLWPGINNLLLQAAA